MCKINFLFAVMLTVFYLLFWFLFVQSITLETKISMVDVFCCSYVAMYQWRCWKGWHRWGISRAWRRWWVSGGWYRWWVSWGWLRWWNSRGWHWWWIWSGWWIPGQTWMSWIVFYFGL